MAPHDIALALMVAGVVLFLYFIPTVVAAARNHHNALAIFATNFCFGWLLIGWAAALIWACTAPRRLQSAPPAVRWHVVESLNPHRVSA